MAQGPNYNVILPFTTTGSIVASTIVAGGLTVNGNISAQQYIAIANGTEGVPAYSFAGVGTTTGMFLNTASTPQELAFSTLGTVAAAFEMRSFAGGATTPALRLAGSATSIYLTTDPASTARAAFFGADATTTVALLARQFFVQPGSAGTGMVNGNGTSGFIFDTDNNLQIMTSATTAAVWDVARFGQYFCRPGVISFATTAAVASATRSGGHYTNLIAGITTVFVTLPSTLPGMQYTISNAQAGANTVVISPIAAADTLNVFGLTKAAGASVAANVAFSSITFHCVTSSQWLATDIMGTWV